MKEVLMLKGLPASGKSTFARELTTQGYVRVNKDDLRFMLHNGKHSKGNEKQVLAMRDAIAADSLDRGRNVVIDDTNFNPVHEETLRELAKAHSAEFRVDDHFLEVPIEECIERDLKRHNSVGERVIRQMYNEYIKPEPEVYISPNGKPLAIMVDVDGTLAHMNGRGPYDPTLYHTDEADAVVGNVVRSYHGQGYKILICSGRDETYRDVTTAWLKDHGVPFDDIFMRRVGDKRKDSIIKRELFDEHIRDNYQIEFILDDRNQVVEMWRSMGLKVFQVADGDF